jgi:hypothetical protein
VKIWKNLWFNVFFLLILNIFFSKKKKSTFFSWTH